MAPNDLVFVKLPSTDTISRPAVRVVRQQPTIGDLYQSTFLNDIESPKIERYERFALQREPISAENTSVTNDRYTLSPLMTHAWRKVAE